MVEHVMLNISDLFKGFCVFLRKWVLKMTSLNIKRYYCNITDNWKFKYLYIFIHNTYKFVQSPNVLEQLFDL